MKKIILALMITLMGFAAANAEQAILSWDANTEADLAGYEVHFGTTSQTYVAPIVLGLETEYEWTTETALPCGDSRTVFFALKAFDTNGNRSGFSSEVSKEFDVDPCAPQNLKLIIKQALAEILQNAKITTKIDLGE